MLMILDIKESGLMMFNMEKELYYMEMEVFFLAFGVMGKFMEEVSLWRNLDRSGLATGKMIC
jgi:hypothetical protein